MRASVASNMTGTRGEGTALYTVALGVHFGELAPVLQRLHSERERRLRGMLRVNVASQPWLRLLLWLARMPRPAAAVACRIRIRVHRTGECWQRHIGTRLLASQQALGKRGQIVEHLGPLALHLRNKVARAGLWQRTVRTTFLGLTLPAWLSLCVVARERPIDANSYYCNIRLHTPLFGRLLQYRGVLVFEDQKRG